MKFSILFILLIITEQVVAQTTIFDVLDDTKIPYSQKILTIEADSMLIYNNSSEFEQKRYKRLRLIYDTRIDSAQTPGKLIDAHQKYTVNSFSKAGSGLTYNQLNLIESNMILTSPLDDPSNIGQINSICYDPNDYRKVYAGGCSSGLWKTNDITVTEPHWECISPFSNIGVYGIVINPLNTDIIYIATGFHINGGYISGDGDYGIGILKTEDGGISWTYVKEFDFLAGEHVKFEKLIMRPDNPNTIIALCCNSIWKTIDAGINWTEHILPAGGNSSLNIDYCYRDIEYNKDNPMELIACGSNCIAKSTNSGNNWTDISGDLLVGCVLGESGTYKVTMNCGNQWTDKVGGNFPYELYDVDFSRLRTGVAVGENGVIRRTSDAPGNPSEIGYKVTIQHWLQVTSNTTSDLFDIHAFSDVLRVASGSNGTIVRNKIYVANQTTQNVWGPVTMQPATSNTLWSVNCFDNNDAIAVGSSGIIYISDNVGNEDLPSTVIFTTVTSPTTNDLFAIHTPKYPDNPCDFAVAVGSSGTVIRTPDRGQNWTTIDIGTILQLNDVFFINEELGLLCGNNGEIYKSTDGGLSWTQKTSGTTQNLNSVYIYNNYAFCAGNNGTILKSADEGESWTALTSGTTTNLFSICFPYLEKRFAAAYNPVAGQQNFGIIGNIWNDNNSTFFISTSQGFNTQTYNVLTNDSYPWIYDLECSPNGNYYGMFYVMSVSTDNGVTFNVVPSYKQKHPDQRAMHFIPGGTTDNYIIGHDGGIAGEIPYYGISFRSFNGDLCALQFINVGLSEEKQSSILSGGQDVGTWFRKPDGKWYKSGGGDGGRCEINLQNSNYLYGIANGSFRYSTSGTVPLSSGGATIPQLGSFTLSNPQNMQIVYKDGGSWDGTSDLWIQALRKNINFGIGGNSTWSQVHYKGGAIYSGAMNINYPENMIVSRYDVWLNNFGNISITNDDWQSVIYLENSSIPGGIIGLAPTSDIEYNPNNPDEFWITFSRWEAAYKIFYTNNGGTSFQNITYDLPNFPVNCIYYDLCNQRTLVGTDFGIWIKDDGTQHWYYDENQPKMMMIMDLKKNRTNNKLYIAAWGNGLWEADLSCYYPNDEINITESQNWTEDKKICGNLIISNISTLTISSNVTMFEGSKVLVKPGSKLILDGGKITNDYNTLWQGIEVQGTSTASQYPALNNPNYGRVELKNGAVIENALTGIKVFATDANGDIIANTTGGIVVATNATFRNNKIAVHFEPYNNFYPTPASPRNNLSYFRNCTFETTQELNDNTQHPEAFVLLNGVNGITFHGNTFSNTALPEFELTKRGIGIKSINSGYNVNANCISQVQPCTNYDRNEFTGLYYGIYAQNATSAYPITIDRNSFIKNNRGVFLSGINNARVINNEFDVGKTEIITYPTGSKGPVPPPIPVSVIFYGYGLYLSDVPNFDVQENEFYSTDNGHYGSIVQNGGANPKDFYNNGYRDMRVGFQSGSDNSGMQIKCNRFIQNLTDADIGLTSGTIAESQGKCILNNTLLPAGNQFSYTNFDIKANNGVTPFRYRHHSGSPTTPQNFTPIIVNPFQCQADFSTASCPSRLNTEITLLQLLTNINTLNNQINTLKTQIDGGSTQEMLNKVASNMSSAQLKDELVTASPYLSDTVMISTLTRTQPLTPGHIKEVLVPNSPLTKKVLTVFDEQTLPQGIKDEVMTAQTGTSERALLEQEINTVELEKNIAVNQLVNLYMEDTTGTGMENIIAFYETQTDAISQKMLVNRYLSNSECIKAKETLEKLAKNNTEEITYQSLYNILTELCNEGKTVYEMTETQAYAVGEIALTNTMAASQAQAIMTQVYGDRYWEVIEELLDFNVQTIKGILTENAECGGAPVANVQIVLIDERGNAVKGLTPVFTNQNGEFSFSLNEIKCLDLNALFAINTQNGYSLSAKIYQTISQWIEQSPVTIEFKNVNLEWADNYSSPDSLMNIGTAIDITGNIYVAGRAAQNSPGGIHDDIVLLKYSPRGEMLWNRLFNAAKTSSEYTDDIAVDSEGNCYISVNSTTSNVVLVKYTPSGNLEWQSSLQTGANVQCKSNGIEIDSQGNICIAGYVKDVYGGKSDFLAASYSKTGTLNWYRTYNKEEYDYATDIKTDKQRNVIITGYANNPGTTTNSLITLKYSKNGILQWMKEHGNRGEQCFSEKMAVSDNGDIYLAGYCDFNINVIKYSSQGSLMWGKSHQTPTSDWINDITIDGNGNIIVTGCSNEDIIVIKYTSGGGVDWQGTYNGEKGSRDVGMAVTTDAESNIYITGVSGRLPMPPQPPPGKQREEIILKDYNYDIITMKYNPQGGKEWLEHYSLVPDKKNAGFALAVSENNNVYVTGTVIDNNLSYMTTLKYSQCPAQANLRASEVREPENEETGSDIQVISFGANTITVYPNPYSDNTIIELIAKTESEVKLEVYTLTGQFVSNVYTGTLKSGTYKYDFSAKKLGYSAGAYILRAAINNEVSSYWLVELK